MSVHTTLTTDTVKQFIASYSLGELLDYRGITAGITNTIYRVSTTEGEFVLTLFEELRPEQLPFFIDLQIFLQEKNFQLPKIFGEPGSEIKNLANKPAILGAFLPGTSPVLPTRQQANEIGETLAKLHLAVTDISFTRENPFDLTWHETLAHKVMPHLNNQQQALLQNELSYQEEQNYTELPRDIIHMDLFPDNVLFVGDRLSALLDFYFACEDSFVYDLAVTMNAWSLTETGINNTIAEMLLVAYQMTRPLSKTEMQQLKNLRRYAALHFWLTRLRDQYLVSAEEGVLIKSPQQLEDLLRQLQ